MEVWEINFFPKIWINSMSNQDFEFLTNWQRYTYGIQFSCKQQGKWVRRRELSRHRPRVECRPGRVVPGTVPSLWRPDANGKRTALTTILPNWRRAAGQRQSWQRWMEVKERNFIDKGFNAPEFYHFGLSVCFLSTEKNIYNKKVTDKKVNHFIHLWWKLSILHVSFMNKIPL